MPIQRLSASRWAAATTLLKLYIFSFNPRYDSSRETQALLLIWSLTSSETTGGEIRLENAGSVKVKHNPGDKNSVQQADLALGL